MLQQRTPVYTNFKQQCAKHGKHGRTWQSVSGFYTLSMHSENDHQIREIHINLGLKTYKIIL